MRPWIPVILTALLAAAAGAQSADSDGQTSARTGQSSGVRKSMWDLWQATVQAPDSGQADPAPDPKDKPIPIELGPDPVEPAGPHPEDDPLRGIRRHDDRLIPVRLGPAGQAQAPPVHDAQDQQPPAQADDARAASAADADPKADDARARTEKTGPASPATDANPAGDDVPDSDSTAQAQPQQPESDQGDPSTPPIALPDDLPAQLKARIRAAQAGTGNNPTELMELGDSLYQADQVRAAEYFYRLALPRSSKQDRPWILLQIGNSLRNRDAARAREMYQVLLQEYPKSRWARIAGVQDRILAWRIHHSKDLDTEVEEVLAEPDDPLSNL